MQDDNQNSQNNQDKDRIDEIDVELDDNQQQSSAKRPLYAQNTGQKKRIVLIVLGVVAGLALIGAAVYWWAAGSEADTQEEAAVEEVAEDEAASEREAPSLSPAEAAEIVTFNSETLELEFDHRRDWTVTESADGSRVTLSSPPVGYQTVDGEVPASQGVFTLSIQRGVPQAAQDAINNADAVLDSELIAYNEPTEMQRHYTNVSYAGRDGDLSFVIITGSAEYDAGEALSGTLPLGDDYYLIAGGFGEDPDGVLDFDYVPTSEADSQVVQQAIAVVESLKLY